MKKLILILLLAPLSMSGQKLPVTGNIAYGFSVDSDQIDNFRMYPDTVIQWMNYNRTCVGILTEKQERDEAGFYTEVKGRLFFVAKEAKKESCLAEFATIWCRVLIRGKEVESFATLVYKYPQLPLESQSLLNFSTLTGVWTDTRWDSINNKNNILKQIVEAQDLLIKQYEKQRADIEKSVKEERKVTKKLINKQNELIEQYEIQLGMHPKKVILKKN